MRRLVGQVLGVQARFQLFGVNLSSSDLSLGRSDLLNFPLSFTCGYPTAIAPSEAQSADAAIPQVTPPNRTNHSVPYLLFTYREAEYGAYPKVPRMRIFFTPNLLARTLKIEQPKTINLGGISLELLWKILGSLLGEAYPKVNALAPLTKYGSCCPPAPVPILH